MDIDHAYSDPTNARRPCRNDGVMEGPISIAIVFLLYEAHRLICRLYRTKKFKELVLWRLHAAPSGVDDLSDSAEQGPEERGLFSRISSHSP